MSIDTDQYVSFFMFALAYNVAHLSVTLDLQFYFLIIKTHT